MEVSSKYKYIRISAQKCRLIADQVRGLPVDKALNLLKFSKQRAARFVQKTLNSAIANAENNEGVDIDELYVTAISIDEGPTMKRMRARAKGRGSRIFKRTSHIAVTVSDA